MTTPRPAASRGLAALLLLPLFPACDHPYDGPPVTQDDSAGVRVVEAHVPVWNDTTRWRLDPGPLLDLQVDGSLDAHVFSRIRGMRWLPDGSIAIANTGTGEIRLFTPAGGFVASAGGEGDAPGEFAGMRLMELVGDSVLALDRDGRVKVFGPGPEFARTMSLQPGVESLHYLDDATLVAAVTAAVLEPETPGIVRPRRALLRFGIDGTLLDSIGWIAGNETYSDHGTFVGTPLFPRRSHVDTHDGRIYHGSADLMEVRELSSSGELLRILRIPDYPLELGEEDVRAEREARVAMAPDFARDGLEKVPAPATRPAFSDLLVGPTGAIWLRPFDGASEGGTPLDWQVLASDGTWLGGVTVPTNVRLWEIGMDEALGSWIDGSGQQHPLVLRLRRSGVGG